MAYDFAPWPTSYREISSGITEAGWAYMRKNKIFTQKLSAPFPIEFIHSEITVDPGPKAKLKDIIDLTGGLLVGQKFRDLVEEFEPGIHFFHPVKLKRKVGDVHQPYYFFLPGQKIDAILPTGELGKNNGAYYYGLEPDSEEMPRINAVGGGLVFSKPAIAGKHVWIPDWIGHGTFVSDAFQKEFKKRKLTNAHFQYCPEVDEPFDLDALMAAVWEARKRRSLDINSKR